MTFRALMDQVRKLVSTAAEGAGYHTVDFDVSEPPRKEFGDLTCNIAFQLSRYAKKAPPKIAAEIIERIKPNILEDSFVLSAEPHPAGYINFKANYAKLSTATLERVLQESDKYGCYDSGK
ncbi:MAG TPA: arginine--tRNA ligase, partial [Nitrososphaera sp.]|nr:arginine--tRNA ligase [Nitrososphaera sp.]